MACGPAKGRAEGFNDAGLACAYITCHNARMADRETIVQNIPSGIDHNQRIAIAGGIIAEGHAEIVRWSHEVPKWIWEIALSCKHEAQRASALFGISDQTAPIVGLNMAFNQLIFGAEILDNYYARWSNKNVADPAEANRVITENAERVALAMKTTLVGILSAFEFAAKSVISGPSSPVKFAAKEKVYLGGIMAKCADISLCNQLELWSFAIEMRNALVHNNGIASRDISLNLADQSSLRMERGAMMVASPRTQAQLLREICSAYIRWCHAVLKHRGNGSHQR